MPTVTISCLMKTHLSEVAMTDPFYCEIKRLFCFSRDLVSVFVERKPFLGTDTTLYSGVADA